MIYVFVVKGVTRDFLIISPKKFVLCIHSSDDNHSFRFTQFLILTYMLVDSQADYRYQTKEIMLKCPLLSKGSFTNCVDKQGEGGLLPNNMSSFTAAGYALHAVQQCVQCDTQKPPAPCE